MLNSEQELAVQVTQIDGVKVDDVHLAKPGKKEVLQQLTANSAGTNKENTGLEEGTYQYLIALHCDHELHLLTLRIFDESVPRDCLRYFSRPTMMGIGEHRTGEKEQSLR